MNSKGSLIFWGINELKTTKEELERLGFDKFVPRNDYKSALIKALKLVTKGNEKMYRRFNDGDNGEVSFGVYGEQIVGDELDISKELTVKLDKRTGSLTHVSGPEPLFLTVRDTYRAETATIDSNQFRQLVLRMVGYEAHGIAMRQGGGIYYVKDAFKPKLDKLQALFNAFPTSTKLNMVPIYDDEGTLNALEDAARADVFGEIESLINDINAKFADGSMTKRMLQSRKDDAAAIFEKIKVHRDTLRNAAAEVTKKLGNVGKAMEALTRKVEAGVIDPEDFINELAKL